MARKKNEATDVDGTAQDESQVEAPVAETRVKLPPEIVDMTDGRKVEFTGRTKMDKTILIDEAANTAAVRFDFRNGMTATYPVPPQHLLYAAGHGWAQKLGDHVAGMKDEQTKEPASEEDMFLAIESLYNDLNAGGWNKVRTGEGTVSGAGVILRALALHFKKPVATIKQILEAQLAEDKAQGGSLSRKALYKSFRSPDTDLGKLILAMEAEKAKPKETINIDKVFSALQSATAE